MTRRTQSFWVLVACFFIFARSASADDDQKREMIVEGVKTAAHMLDRFLKHHPAVGFQDGKCTLPLALLVKSNGEVEDSRISNNIHSTEFEGHARLVQVFFRDVKDQDARAARITIMADKKFEGIGTTGIDRRRSVPVSHGGYVGVSSSDDSLYIGGLTLPGVQGGRGTFFKNNPQAKIELVLIDNPKTAGVLLCEDDNYKGMAVWVPAGKSVPNMEDEFGEMNDAVDSIKTYGGAKVTLYEHEKFEGKSKEITRDTPQLKDFHDLTSAVKAVK